MYHLDPITREAVYCRVGKDACAAAPAEAHYGSISEAVQARSLTAREHLLQAS